MASKCWPSSVMAIKLNTCDHTEAKSLMISVRNTNLIDKILNNHHDIADHDSYEKCYAIRAFCKTEHNSSETFEVENFLTFGEVVDKFHIKCIEFTCEKIGKTPLDVTLEMAAETCLFVCLFVFNDAPTLMGH